jgi:hypothetical protein
MQVRIAENAAAAIAYAAGVHRELLVTLVAFGAEDGFAEYFH